MANLFRWIRRRFAFSAVRPLIADRRGNVLAMSAFAMPALLATFGLAFESAHWYQTQRAMQNAADSAVIAAASNGTASYATEGRQVAAQYGFVNGTDGVTVTIANSVACPGGGSTCYSATITKPIPLVLGGLVGFTGDTTYNGSSAKLLSAVAISSQSTSPRQYCILALAGSGAAEGIRTNGSPKADLAGCDIMSNTNAQCNGHDLKAGHGDAHGTSEGCGATQTSGLPVISDPYLSLASNVTDKTCAKYATKPSKKKDPALPGTNLLSGAYNWTTTQPFCGDVQLTGNVTITSPSSGVVMLIKNGQLDLNGFTLTTTAGSGLTIIFTGDNATGYTRAPTGSGTLDIAAPTSGPWSGVAIYQDPSQTNGVDISEAGNSPAWKITGLVYLPKASVTFSGAVNKSSNGKSCFALVIDNLTINGTGSILAQGECAQAGLTRPTGSVPSRGKLVS